MDEPPRISWCSQYRRFETASRASSPIFWGFFGGAINNSLRGQAWGGKDINRGYYLTPELVIYTVRWCPFTKAKSSSDSFSIPSYLFHFLTKGSHHSFRHLFFFSFGPDTCVFLEAENLPYPKDSQRWFLLRWLIGIYWKLIIDVKRKVLWQDFCSNCTSLSWKSW